MMPRCLARVADKIVTLGALDLGGRFASLNDTIATWVRTELLVWTSTNLIGVHEALEFFEAVCTHDCCYITLLY